MIVVLCVEGVVSEPGVPLAEAGPTLFGRRLYTTLYNAGESLVIISTDENRQMVKEWLLREGFADYVKLIVKEDDDAPDDLWKANTIRKIVSAGQHIMYVVDVDPASVPVCASLGVPALLTVHPWGEPGRRSDAEDLTYRSWDIRVDTIQRESLRYAESRQKRKEQGNEV